MTGPAIAMREILVGLDAIDIDAIAKNKFRELVCTVGRRNGIKAMAVWERLVFAEEELAKGTSRTAIRKRLVNVHQISDRQAIRVISQALETRHKSKKNGAV